MSLPLFPALIPFLVVTAAIAALTVAVLLGVLAQSVAHNRSTRLRRQQSVRAYYTGRLALHH